MEVIPASGEAFRSGFGAPERAESSGEKDALKAFRRTGHGKKKRAAGTLIWRTLIFCMVVCLLAELGTAMGFSVTQFFESAAAHVLTVIPQEEREQFQNLLYNFTFGWTADSLPVCGYALVASGGENAESENASVSGYAAVIWSAVMDEPVIKSVFAMDRADLENGVAGSPKENGDGGTAAAGEKSGSKSGKAEVNGGENESGAEEMENKNEADSSTGKDGDKTGEDEEENGDKTGEDEEKNGDETGEDGAEDGDETSAGTFLMPSVTGTVYTAETLTYQFLASNFYNISSSTDVYESELNGSLLSLSLALSEITEEPQILIYHTHSHEFFADSDTSDLNTGIVGVGTYLTELLEEYGYSVLHLTEEFDYVDGVLNRSKAYTYAAARLKEVLAEYPSIEVMIDLHRDGVDDDLRLVTEINGKSTAMIMFFNGMSRTTSGNIAYLPNTNLQANLAFSLQLKVKAEAYYPGFTRKNYIKPYRYNLHLLEKSLLIEAGAQTNTFEEVKNAMEPLAVLLHIQLSGME